MPRRQTAGRRPSRPDTRNDSERISGFPENVREALTQLSAATQQLLEQGASENTASPFVRLSRAEIQSLRRPLRTVHAYVHADDFSAETAAAMLSDGPAQVVLLRLVLSALRITPGELRADGELSEVAQHALGVVVGLLCKATWHGSAPQHLAAAAFTRGLLRAQALHAASRQLFTLAEALPVAPAAASAADQGEKPGQGGVQQQQGQRQGQRQGRGRESKTDASYEERISAMIIEVAWFAYKLVSSFGNVLEAEWYMDLAAALHDSNVLEHAARVLLLLMPRVGRCAPRHEGGVKASLAASADAHSNVAGPIIFCLDSSALPGAPAAASQLRAALAGPCVRAAVLSYAVTTLGAADGGSAYGLPSELFTAVPVYISGDDGNGAGRSGPGRLQQFEANKLFAALRLLALKPMAQPPGRRGALLLAHRIGSLAVASAREDARAAGVSSSVGGAVAGSSAGAAAGCAATGGIDGSGGPRRAHAAGWDPLRTVLAPDASTGVCFEALDVGRIGLLERLPRGSAHWRADGEKWWRLAVAVVRHALPHVPHASHEESLCLARFMELAAEAEEVWLEAGHLFRLPPETPPLTAAALSGGVLPCLELLMRRAGEAPEGPESTTVRQLLGTSKLHSWLYVLPLLAYGDPRQAASLVTTLGKLLRAIDPRVATTWPDFKPTLTTQHFFVYLANSLMYRVLRVPPSSAAPQTHGGASGPVPQPARLTSLAACEWLPQLSCLALAAMQAALERTKGQEGGAGDGCMTMLNKVLLPTLLYWLPVLARRCAGQGTTTPEAAAAGGTGLSGAPGAGAGGAPEGAAVASWRTLLLVEMGAVQLLGTALELAAAVAAEGQGQGPNAEEEHPLRDGRVLRRLIESCCAVADLFATAGGCLGAALAAATVVPPDSSAAAAMSGGSSSTRQGHAESGGAARTALPWRPEHLRAVAARLWANVGVTADVELAEGLAYALEEGRCFRGVGGVMGPIRGVAGTYDDQPPEIRRLFEDALVPPPEARRLQRTCGKPGCTNLAGDSEAELQLKACPGCGAVGYCGRACQVAHLRAGHGAACKGGKEGGHKHAPG